MSINHFSAELPEAHWWSHYAMDRSPSAKPFLSAAASAHNPAAAFCLAPPNLYRASDAAAATVPMFCNQNGAVAFDLNNEDEEELVDEHNTAAAAAAAATSRELVEQQQAQEVEIPKDRLFEKPLTPSDVGKLNRLVIPKQHAEKHFPLNGGAESGENGLLLGFEDELGKSWRFRYSYWNSSQSYVLTKGWSRFVKEKRLDAGDIVIFARHRVDAGRLFIGWRRRSSIGGQDNGSAQPPAPLANGGGGGGAVAWGRMIYSGHPYPIQQHPPSNSLHFQSESAHAGTGLQKQTTSSAGSGNSKTLRLFGVNLECQADESEPVGSPMSIQGQAHLQHPYHHHHPYHQYYSNNHMDISFSGADVYRQG